MAGNKGIGFPVVPKIAIPRYRPQDGSGGLGPHPANAREVRSGPVYREISDTSANRIVMGVAAQKLGQPGLEIRVVAARNTCFGSIITFG